MVLGIKKQKLPEIPGWRFRDAIWDTEGNLSTYIAESPTGRSYFKSDFEKLDLTKPEAEQNVGGSFLLPLLQEKLQAGQPIEPEAEVLLRQFAPKLPPLEPLPKPEPQKEQDTLTQLFQRVYTDKFLPDVDSQTVLQGLSKQAQDNPQSFLTELQQKGRTEDTIQILQMFSAEPLTEEMVSNFFQGQPQITPEQNLLMKALPLMVKPRTLDWAIKYFGNNPDKLRRELITAGRNADTEALVRSLYPQITDRGIKDYFSPRAPGMELLGQMPTLTWLDKVRELRKDPEKLVPFASSAAEMVTLGKVMLTAKDIEDGKEVSREDLLALKEYVEQATKDTTWGFEVADVIAQLAPFAGEFIATGGIFSVGKTAVVRAGQQALKRIATKTGLRVLEGRLAKFGVEAVGILAGGTLRAPVAGITRIPAATLEKQLQATLTGDEESVFQSALKAFGEQWIEVVSESTGGLFAPLAAPVKGQLVKLGLFKAFQKANPGKSVNDLRRIMEKAGYHGVLGEMLEERVADVGHGILEPLGLSDQKFSFPSVRQLTVELAAFSVPGATAMAIETTPAIFDKLSPAVKKAISEAAEEAKIAPERGAVELPGRPEERPSDALQQEYTTLVNQAEKLAPDNPTVIKAKEIISKITPENQRESLRQIEALEDELKGIAEVVTPTAPVTPEVTKLTTYQGDIVAIGEMVNYGAFGDRGLLVGGTAKEAMVRPIQTKEGVLIGFKDPVNVKDSFRKIHEPLTISKEEQAILTKAQSEVAIPKAEALPAQTWTEAGIQPSMLPKAEKGRIRELERPVTADEIITQEAEPFQEAVSQGVPPSEAPPPPAQTITTPVSLPEPPRDSEIKRIITQSEEQVRQDQPKAITNLLRKVPGVRQLLEFERPGLKMTGENQKVLTAMVAEQAARSDVSVWAMGTRLKLLSDIREVFGKDVLRGAKSDIKFIGTAEQATNPITGTLKDIADNPELYDLSGEQLRVLADINIHNDQMLDWVTSNYGAEIGKWTPKPGGAYLPNVDVGDDVVEWLGSETRAVATGRGKTRIWATARDRMAGKTPFTPELDVQKLIEGLDNFKASAAAGQTYKTAIGGLTRLEAVEKTHPELFNKMTTLRKELNSLRGSAGTIESNIHTAIDDFLKSSTEDTDLLNLKDNLDVRLKAGKRKGLDMSAIQDRITAVQDQIDEIRPAWQVANLKPYVFVQQGLYRYFPADQVKLILESLATTSNHLLGFVEKWRGQAFSGDFSPFTIQGVIGVLADPWGSLKVGVGGIRAAVQHRDFLRSVRIEALADDIANNPVEWGEFASLMGRSLTGVPREYAAGFLSKIPGFDKFTENTFITVTRGSFNLWQRNYKNMVKHGVPILEAKVAAADIASKVYPLVSQTRLGQSQARHAVLRALPTSYSFIRQPITLTMDALRGLTKLATLQKLTPAESMAVKVAVTGAASTLAVSATSAFLSALAMGKDDDEAWQAALDAINPHPFNGKFASIIIGNVRIPLGGPYRALFRAMYPAQVKGIPFPVPFAGLPNYARNRITPAIRTQLDLVPAIIGKPEAAVDYNKVQIFNTKDGTVFENILRSLEYEFENFLPLTAGEALESIRQGEKYREPIWQQVIGQFMGVNPVTLDNTYIDRQIKQLGIEKQGEAKPFTIQKPEVYNTKDLYGDVSSVLRRRTGEGFKDKPLTLAIKEAMIVKDTSDSFLNIRLTNLSDDQWELLRQRQDLEDTTEFDKLNPQLANVSRRDYTLLLERQKITDKRKLAEFDKEHPELSTIPRFEWLKSHPKENAQLAIFGQAKILSKEAYNEVQRLVKELDIPDKAVPDFNIPKDSVDNYFKYQDMVSQDKNSSWEAQLMLAKDNKLREFLGLKPIETPLASLEIKATPDYHGIWNKLNKEDDPDWVGNLDDKIKDKDGLTARDRVIAELKATKIGDMRWIDLDRKVEAIERGTDENPIPDETVDAYIKHYQIVDQTSGNSAEAKLNRYDNPEFNDFLMSEDYWGKQKAKPLDEDKFYLDNYLVPRWRIEVDKAYKERDTEYNAIKNPIEAKQDKLRAEWLAKPENAEYRKNKRRKEAYELNNTLTGIRLPIDQIENYVGYYEIPQKPKGKRQDRFIVENHEFAEAMFRLTGKAMWKVKAEDVPNVAYDDIYDKYEDLFEDYQRILDTTIDEKEQSQKINALFAENPAFKEGYYRRAGYGLLLPDEHVEDYTTYMLMPEKGWSKERYIKLHPEFFNEIQRIKEEKTKKPWMRDIKWDEVPSEKVEALWFEYDAIPSQLDKRQQDFRIAHPDLDAWLVLTGKVKRLATEEKRRTQLTAREKFWEDFAVQQSEFEKSMAELRKKLGGL